jgi:hypothetical protein
MAQDHDCAVLHLEDPAERGGLRGGIIRAVEAETGTRLRRPRRHPVSHPPRKPTAWRGPGSITCTCLATGRTDRAAAAPFPEKPQKPQEDRMNAPLVRRSSWARRFFWFLNSDVSSARLTPRVIGIEGDRDHTCCAATISRNRSTTARP